MLFIVIGCLVGLGILVYGALTVRQADETLDARLQRYDLHEAGSLRELEMQMPRSERILNPVRRKIADGVRLITPVGSVEKIQTRLMQAGNPADLTVQDFLGLKGIFAICMGLVVLLLAGLVFQPDPLKLFLILAGAVALGYYLPNLWLRRVINQRKREIQRYLADAIDILAISIEAGQGFDGALATLSNRKRNALTQEFDRFRLEIQAGKARRDALRDLALRTDVDDLKQFVAATIQADQLGIGFGTVLKTQAVELRIRRRQRAELKARQAPVKMLFPLIFLMFPSLFLVILGPAVPSLLQLGHAGG